LAVELLQRGFRIKCIGGDEGGFEFIAVLEEVVT